MSFRRVLFSGMLATVLSTMPIASAQWIEFTDATATQISAAPGLFADDFQEKDYAWGDVDKDGDVDLVIVRKEPFTTPGKEPNVLLLNQGGVLTDRTADFASASDVPGDDGFLTPTNDRDVALVDLDLDGWLDIVTAPTISPDDHKHIGHPRVYRNLGCAGACEGTDDWLGFRYEHSRIPQMLTWAGVDDKNPRFCAVSAGDVTGDGYPDLYFADYDESVGQPNPGNDFNDKLLINFGAFNPGVFFDATNERFADQVPGILVDFEVSAFGTANEILDMNGDGIADIVKSNSLGQPYYVGIAVNDPATNGFFDTYTVLHHGAPYFVSAGDVNADDKLDVIITEDGADRYLINQGNGTDTIPDFFASVFSFAHESGLPFTASSDDGFGGNSLVADLDGDGWDEVLITDVDADVPGCNRRLHIYRNLRAAAPGEVPVLQEQTSGTGCPNFNGNPPTCIVAGIPTDRLEAVHDVAVFDVNGDGWNDMIVGRCFGSEVYLQNPSGPPAGGTPDGDGVPGQQLVLDKSVLEDHLTLNWSASCLPSDDDYAVYAGSLAEIGDHSPAVCSTAGATTQTLPYDSGDRYYLIVPNNGETEGSYGRDSRGTPRLRRPDGCFPQNAGACNPS